MKLLTLNLAGYKDWQDREQAIVDMLNQQDADIVFFQEVKLDMSLSAKSQAGKINSLLQVPYKYMIADVTKFYQPSTGEPYREGLAVLSKFSILQSEVFVLNKAPDDKHSRIVQLLDLAVDDHKFKVANVHFSNNTHSVEQLSELLDILSLRNEERYIAGDFNILEMSRVSQAVVKNYHLAYDHSQYISFPSEGITLDHIVIPKQAEFISVKTIEGLSDHAALIAEVEVKYEI